MDERKPGLEAIRKAREERERGKRSRITPNVILSATTAVIAILLVYHYVEEHKLDTAKAALLAKQHAVEATLGKEWFPLRDRVEKLTLEAAAHYDGDFVDPLAGRWDFRQLPGVYLRLRLRDAKDAPTLRAAAPNSLRDAFVACLLHEPNQGAARAEPDAGAFPDQPWNLSQAYAATRILTDDWVTEVKDASDAMRLRVFEQQYETAARDEIPVAVEFVRRARFFLLVLDEDSDAASHDAGAPPSEQDLQMVPHYARIIVAKLDGDGVLLRLRRSANASFVFAGEQPVTDPETLDAMKRQVQNCALAQAVQVALTDGGAP